MTILTISTLFIGVFRDMPSRIGGMAPNTTLWKTMRGPINEGCGKAHSRNLKFGGRITGRIRIEQEKSTERNEQADHKSVLDALHHFE